MTYDTTRNFDIQPSKRGPLTSNSHVFGNLTLANCFDIPPILYSQYSLLTTQATGKDQIIPARPLGSARPVFFHDRDDSRASLDVARHWIGLMWVDRCGL